MVVPMCNSRGQQSGIRNMLVFMATERREEFNVNTARWHLALVNTLPPAL